MVFNLIRALYPELNVSQSTIARLLRAFEDDNPALVTLAREAQPARQQPRPRVQIGNVDIRQHLQAQQQYLADLRKQLSGLRGEFVRLVTERVGDLPLLDSATGAFVVSPRPPYPHSKGMVERMGRRTDS